MTVFMEAAYKGLLALLQLLTHPFYYVGILFIILQYRRQIALERKLFSTKLHSLLSETWRALLWGWIGGLAASVLMGVVGATVQADGVLVLWLVSLLLLVVRVRFLCWAYAVGLIGIAQTLLGAFTVNTAAWSPPAAWLANAVLSLNMPSLLAVIAVLHLVEAGLIWHQGAKAATPMFYESKRGKIVGGYHIQGFWPVALFLLVPLEGGSQAALPWTPILGGDMWSGGWTIIAFPVMIGFAELTLTRLPKEKTRKSAKMLTIYSATVLLLAILAHQWPAAVGFASLGCILLHEAVLLYSRWDEAQRTPYFVHDERGLKILGILPGSPAEEMGLAPGEILHKVNGIAVTTKQQLHHAMQRNSAFCKLEVLNLAGESKFLKRAMFSGEHHLLGIILSPDRDALYYAQERQPHLLLYFSKKLLGLFSNQSGTRPM
ncbi:PDZ domain-containing protein [Paenibacillus xerothermodurans]|uniref:PDZ domain-containing protein n=1 Tax=Paenibacillus xerothermodurans TaxID=1977292 RepID=A0A2W1NI87_PAEXE|nr:PDZ domain-containing protein [Paenibacillus xerothermodurans]PZE19265.1 PDZ domain-containing protein [Paenibacillus xerothermodurans]